MLAVCDKKLSPAHMDPHNHTEVPLKTLFFYTAYSGNDNRENNAESSSEGISILHIKWCQLMASSLKPKFPAKKTSATIFFFLRSLFSSQSFQKKIPCFSFLPCVMFLSSTWRDWTSTRFFFWESWISKSETVKKRTLFFSRELYCLKCVPKEVHARQNYIIV